MCRKLLPSLFVAAVLFGSGGCAASGEGGSTSSVLNFGRLPPQSEPAIDFETSEIDDL